MSERDKIERKRNNCLKRSALALIPAAAALLLLYTWAQVHGAFRGWSAPAFVYENLTPRLFVKGNMALPSALYFGVLVLIAAGPMLEIKNWAYYADKLAKARRDADDKRLRDEFLDDQK